MAVGTTGVRPGLPKTVPSLGMHVSSMEHSCGRSQHSQLFTVAAAFGHYFLGSKRETQLNFCSVSGPWDTPWARAMEVSQWLSPAKKHMHNICKAQSAERLWSAG